MATHAASSASSPSLTLEVIYVPTLSPKATVITAACELLQAEFKVRAMGHSWRSERTAMPGARFGAYRVVLLFEDEQTKRRAEQLIRSGRQGQLSLPRTSIPAAGNESEREAGHTTTSETSSQIANSPLCKSEGISLQRLGSCVVRQPETNSSTRNHPDTERSHSANTGNPEQYTLEWLEGEVACQKARIKCIEQRDEARRRDGLPPHTPTQAELGRLSQGVRNPALFEPLVEQLGRYREMLYHTRLGPEQVNKAILLLNGCVGINDKAIRTGYRLFQWPVEQLERMDPEDPIRAFGLLSHSSDEKVNNWRTCYLRFLERLRFDRELAAKMLLGGEWIARRAHWFDIPLETALDRVKEVDLELDEVENSWVME